ncbi:MAG: DUF1501 domain-containing protein [Planctomycetaceae bacterium]|nr:DUF1501 domain-containing protein [Planctomycetaceae bacterium]
MLTIFGPQGRLCDSLSRRELLTVGSLTLAGLSLPDVLRRRVQASPGREAGFGRAESVILVYLQGAPSHIDLWDPKPDAPAEIRGEFSPIATRAPGVSVGEVLPQLAQEADNFAIIRSLGCKPKGLPNHGSAIYMLMTGHDPGNFSPTGLAVPPSREDLPSVGAVTGRYRAAGPGRFGYVAVGAPVKENVIVGVGQGAGLLGGAFDPFTMYDDPTQPLRLETFSLPGDISLDRLKDRVDLRRRVDERLSQSAARESQFPGTSENTKKTGLATFDAYYEKALSLVQSNGAVRAFRLEDEPPAVRERYGMTKFGQSCLLARRLIEARTRFVQVTWPARSDDEPVPGPDGSWDTHRNNFPMLRDHRCPVFDRSLSALVADLADRGLLESTLVVAVGEFGRSPKIGAATTNNVGPGGRDHWPDCYSALIAGGGVRPGQAYGESDRFGAYPKSSPVHPYDLISTIFHAVGIDPDTEYHDTQNRPRRLVDHGRPVTGLF